MTPRGYNILVKPKVAKRGSIFVPDTAKPQGMEWGEVLEGNGYIPNGDEVLYFNREDGEKKIISVKQCLFWR